MSFLWPTALLLLVLLPFGVAGYLAIERRRRARLMGLGSLGVVAGGASGGRRRVLRRWLPAGLVLAGLASLMVALARPQAAVGVPRLEGIVVLAFDVSASMAADDLQPSRMEAAKAAAASFVEGQPAGVIIGVVAFSDSGLSVQVPTSDQVVVLAAIARLHPERGTSLNDGVEAAVAAIITSEEGISGYYTNRSPEPTVMLDGRADPVERTSAAIVLLSDGEATADRDPLAGARIAAGEGIRVYTVGIGSPAGAVIEVEGFSVSTQLDEPMLRAIAETTGGAYHHAASADELVAVYDALDTRLIVRSETIEVTGLVAALGLGLLVLGAGAGLIWLGRLP